MQNVNINMWLEKNSLGFRLFHVDIQQPKQSIIPKSVKKLHLASEILDVFEYTDCDQRYYRLIPKVMQICTSNALQKYKFVPKIP